MTKPERNMLNLRATIFAKGGGDVEIADAEWEVIKPCFPRWLSKHELDEIKEEFRDQRLDGTGGLNYHITCTMRENALCYTAGNMTPGPFTKEWFEAEGAGCNEIRRKNMTAAVP